MGGEAMRVANFSAGPAQLPASVLEKASRAMIDVTPDELGVSIAEIGHRTDVYDRIQSQTIADMASLLNLPSTHSIILMAGGGSNQFSAVPLNLTRSSRTADYIVTGSWSHKAAVEAAKYCDVNIIFNGKNEGYSKCPPMGLKLNHSADPAYIYYCANETIDGVEYPGLPDCPAHIPLVGDFSSCFMSKPFPSQDYARFSVIFAGAQKNVGPPGVTIVIVKNDIVGQALNITPVMLDYSTFSSSQSLYNTPPTISIYMVGLVMNWMKDLGGLEVLGQRNAEKAKLLYDVLQESRLFKCSVDPACRSRMNVVFKVVGDSTGAVLKEFIRECEAQGMIGLSGHRSVGGLRASLFNAQTLENVQRLVTFMKEFENRHS